MFHRVNDPADSKSIDRLDFAYSLFVDQYNKYGEEEAEACREVLESGRAFYPIGTHVKRLEQRLGDEFGSAGCVLVSSGTAAVHVALGAVGVDFGDEVITTPIADTGTVIPILLQGAVPIFVDVDPTTIMITADTIEPALSEKTRAIVVVHYGGYAADLRPILDLARKYHIAVVEDCAQATATVYRGSRAGTMGDVGCFSTNDTKHVSCGDGGFVISGSEHVLYRARLFHDKGFNRSSGVRDPELVGPNYRMTELQAAVLSAQWNKLEDRVQRRERFAQLLDHVLLQVPWVRRVIVQPDDRCSYFSYLFAVSDDAPCPREHICQRLCEAGLPAREGNLYECLYKLRIFHDALPRYMRYLNHSEYATGMCPNAERANSQLVRLEMLETFGVDEALRFQRVFDEFEA